MWHSELCMQKRVYLQQQVRYVHIYSKCGEWPPGIPREGPRLGGETHSHSSSLSPWYKTHSVQNPRRASLTLLLIQVGSREDRRGSKKVDVSTMIHRGPTLHQGLKYCLKQLAEMSSRWVVRERGVQDGPNTQTAPWRKRWVQQTMTVWPNEHAQYSFSFWLSQSPM